MQELQKTLFFDSACISKCLQGEGVCRVETSSSLQNQSTDKEKIISEI